MTFIHGNLVLEIIEAEDLPDMDFSLLPFSKDLSDPYVKFEGYQGGEKLLSLAKTRVVEHELNPNWNETFHIPLCHELDEFCLSVKDYDLKTGDDTMCRLKVSLDDLVESGSMEGWFPLSMDDEEKGKINMRMEYTPIEDVDVSRTEVPHTLFPLRKHCGIRLYQDAHTPAVSPVIDVPTADGEPYDPPCYFEDAVEAIENAEKLVYIAGWSVNPEKSLLRNRDGEDNEPLGELLKRKADEEGVVVLVMIWNEMLSGELAGFELPGLMGTHDEDTANYFEGSNVEVLNAPRNYSNGKCFEQLAVTGSFTHHQKCVIVDDDLLEKEELTKHGRQHRRKERRRRKQELGGDEDDQTRRRIVAFVGGIDLTDGRWDTPEHSLFKTLLHEHKDDFYQNLCASTVDVGPREPWHDIHLYVDGKAAVDVLQNFSERWRFQGADRVTCLYPLTEEEFDLGARGSGGDWKVQFFRSINADSLSFDDNRIQNARNLKGKFYESSIHDAYIHHIRRAKKFIYIENQYFLGSSHCWTTPDPKCCHLVPLEICTRITRAIAEGEDFRVYVVVPMFPEGVPTTSAVQEILSFQCFTMEMMYKRISNAIAEAGSDAHPTDYLSFFCLAKRESPDDVPDEIGMPDGEDEILLRVRTTLRSMIYVHSKMAIFDDEYIIVGSANINQRSMDGNRDSEICIGACQSKFINSDDELKGDVQRFRLALWAAHCGETMEIHLQPSTSDCMTVMKEIGQANVEKYVQAEPEGNSSNLLFYPLDVSQEGEVTTNESFPEIPDLGGSVTGETTGVIPNFITT